MNNLSIRIVIKRVLFSLMIMIAVTLSELAILGLLINNGIMNMHFVPYAMYAILFSMGLVCGIAGNMDNKVIAVVQGVALPIAVIFFVHFLVCNYEIRNFIISTIAVFSGAIVSALVSIKKKHVAFKTKNNKMVKLYKKHLMGK